MLNAQKCLVYCKYRSRMDEFQIDIWHSSYIKYSSAAVDRGCPSTVHALRSETRCRFIACITAPLKYSPTLKSIQTLDQFLGGRSYDG